jgi:hypothetical protein
LELVLIDMIKKSAVADLTCEPIREVLVELEKAHDKDIWREKNERVYRSCFVLILAKRSSELLLNNTEELLSEFPEFSECAADELDLLLKFRNMMDCGIRLFAAAGNKGKLMDIAGRLSGKVYTTGGGSTVEAKRREAIYERLGGVIKKKLTIPRQRKVAEDLHQCISHGQGRYRSRANKGRVVRSAGRPIMKSEPASSPIGGGLTALKIQDPDLMLLEPVAEDGADCQLSSTWVEVIRDCSKFTRKGGNFSAPASPRLPAYSPFAGDDSPYQGEGEGDWGLALCAKSPTPAGSSTAPPSLQRSLSLTLDFSKPIFTEDPYAYAGLDMSFTYLN